MSNWTLLSIFIEKGPKVVKKWMLTYSKYPLTMSNIAFLRFPGISREIRLNSRDFPIPGKLKNPGNIRSLLIRLALMDSDKLDKPAHAKSYIVDTSPKCAEYFFQKDGCSSFLIKCCLKNSGGPANAKLMSP